ncbi:MAG: helix-turn-helix domain-containing protein [Solirubrobacteraceae bacterium]|jgi:excisionase family DNA binding protein
MPSSADGQREALFVRIPSAQARALARIAADSGKPKQEVVSELIARAIPLQDDRATVVGHHAFRPYEPDVLTLEEVAGLLGVEPAAIEELAASGELPGRMIGGAWRFARGAILAWLAGGSRTASADR